MQKEKLMARKYHRFTMQFDTSFNSLLTTLSKDEGVSKVSIIRKAIYFYAYLKKEAIKGGKLMIVNDDSKNNIPIEIGFLFPQIGFERLKKSLLSDVDHSGE